MSGRLSDSEKRTLLQQWEYDVRQLLVAESEGMGDANGDLLSRILNALASLDDEQNTERSPQITDGDV